MRRIAVFLLVAAFTINITISTNAEQAAERKQLVVEDNYFRSNTYRILQAKNGYDIVTVSSRERYKQAVQSTKEVLRLPFAFDVNEISGGFLMPSEINGIVMDIPYNYYSPLESSSTFYFTLLYNGWELEYYNATSLCIQIGLVNNKGITCRLIIYRDYMKVYCNLM